MRRALTTFLLLALVPALASGASLRSDAYYKKKFMQVCGNALTVGCCVCTKAPMLLPMKHDRLR